MIVDAEMLQMMAELMTPIDVSDASLGLDAMREVVAVGRALGVALPEDYAEQRLAFVDGLPETMTSSMHHDLNAGKPLEVSWLSGGVVQLGARVGVDTPLNRAVWAILALHEHGSR